MKLIYFIAASGALATSCGPKTLDCQPRTVNVTGALETDILGSWGDGAGVVTTFHAGGEWTSVVAPSARGPHGNVIGDYLPSGQYGVLDGGVSLSGFEFSASIDEHSLTLSDPSGCCAHTLPAITCTGKDFE